VANFVLETKYVFVDTNIYEGKNFQFLTYELERLSLLASSGEIVLLMSPIIDFEIRDHIKAGAVNAAKSIKDFTKEAMVLRNATGLPVSGAFKRTSSTEIATALLENYGRFIELARPETVPFDDVNPVDVFERYFSKCAPFSEGKKHEFPDGFVCFSLLQFAREKGEKIYVVSNDGDMRDFCSEFSSLIYLSTLDSIIGAFAHVGPYDPARFADQMFASLESEVLESAKRYLSVLEFDTAFIATDVVEENFSFEKLNVLDRELCGAKVGEAEFNVVVGLEIWSHQIVDMFGDFEGDCKVDQYVGVERVRQIARFNAVVDMTVVLASTGYDLQSTRVCYVDPELRTDLSLRDPFAVELLLDERLQ
jgi:uncharacterized protein YunC (DUF1805 family)